MKEEVEILLVYFCCLLCALVDNLKVEQPCFCKNDKNNISVNQILKD